MNIVVNDTDSDGDEDMEWITLNFIFFFFCIQTLSPTNVASNHFLKIDKLCPPLNWKLSLDTKFEISTQSPYSIKYSNIKVHIKLYGKGVMFF